MENIINNAPFSSFYRPLADDRHTNDAFSLFVHASMIWVSEHNNKKLLIQFHFNFQ